MEFRNFISDFMLKDGYFFQRFISKTDVSSHIRLNDLILLVHTVTPRILHSIKRSKSKKIKKKYKEIDFTVQ